jgi:competence protein ComEC
VIAAIVGPTGTTAAAIATTALAAAVAFAVWRPAGAGRRIQVAGTGIAIGVVLLGLRLAAIPPVLGPPPAPTGSGPWTMLVESVGSPREGQQVATLRLVGEAGSDPAGIPLRLAGTLPRFPEVQPGDLVRVAGRPEPRPDSPYGQYLERIGAWGTLRADGLEPLTGPDGPARRLEAWRREAGVALTRVLPEPEAGLAAGILIGLRDRVDRTVAATFTTAGVSHVVAISGWNIAIVAASIAAVAGGVGRRRRAGLTAIAITAYIAFAGASPSVLRAGVMAGVVLVARESGRPERAAAALGWAVVLLLLADPALVGDAGFQLSTLATAGLIAWATPLTDRLRRLGGGRTPGWLAESLGVSLAAQAATTPIVLASFGRLALVAPAVNLLVVPLVAPVMAAGVVALLAGLAVGAGLPTVIGSALALPAFAGLRVMIGLVELGASVPYASLELEPMIAAGLAVASTAIGTIVVAVRGRRVRVSRTAGAAPKPADAAVAVKERGHRGSSPGRLGDRLAVAGLIAAVACLGAVAASRPPGVARLAVLDVGQGDAILLEGSNGSRLLVDGGPDPERLLVALDRRIPPWDRRIDVVVLSHPHEDHVAGLALLLERYRVHRVLEPGMRGPGPGYEAWTERLRVPDPPAHAIIAAGDRLRVDEFALEVRWPIAGSVPAEPADTGTGINNVSVVLLGRVGGTRFLLAGDVEEEVDPSLLAAGLPAVDVLKVAHHGSRTATTEAFVAATRPKVAIASAGAGNRYGHPARATLERLAAAGARVLRTDVDGTVTVTFGADGPIVGREPRPGQAAAPARPAVARLDPGPVRRALLCAVPVRGGPAEPSAPRLTLSTATAALAAAAPTPRDRYTEPSRRVGYHRADDGPRTVGGRRPPALPGSSALVPDARARRRGGRGMARPTHRRPRDRRRPRGGRGGFAAPRRRQAANQRPSGPDPPPRRGLRRVADRPGSRRARASRRQPPGDAAPRRRRLPAVGGVRVARGAHRGLRGQAGRPAPRVDGGPVCLLATTLSGWLGSGDVGRGRASRPAPGGLCLSRGRRRAGRRPSPPLDRRRAPGRDRCPRRMSRPLAPLLYVWGDDDLLAERRVTQFADDLAAELGTQLERWDVKGDATAAGSIIGQLEERLSTSVMFGGGTLAVLLGPSPVIRRNEHRDRLLAAIDAMAPGNALAIVEASTRSDRRTREAPSARKLADRIKALGGEWAPVFAPPPTGLGAWITDEARRHGHVLAPGAAKALADRLGARVTDGDVDRRHLSRIASGELDKLALRHAIDGGPISADDVEALVAETTPGSVFALTDAVATRRVDAALVALDRLLDTSPEPVLLAVLHKRIVELLELGDRVRSGANLPDAGRAMGIASPYRAEMLARQASHWTEEELGEALAELVELDAAAKGVPGYEADAAQRRLALTVWVRRWATPRGAMAETAAAR